MMDWGVQLETLPHRCLTYCSAFLLRPPHSYEPSPAASWIASLAVPALSEHRHCIEFSDLCIGLRMLNRRSDCTVLACKTSFCWQRCCCLDSPLEGEPGYYQIKVWEVCLRIWRYRLTDWHWNVGSTMRMLIFPNSLRNPTVQRLFGQSSQEDSHSWWLSLRGSKWL